MRASAGTAAAPAPKGDALRCSIEPRAARRLERGVRPSSLQALLRQHLFDWQVFDDREAARQAVRRGELSFAVLIPGDFSEQALPGREAGAARLTLYTSEGNSYSAAGFAKRFAPELAHRVNESLNEQRWALVLETAAGRLHQQGCIAFPEGNRRWQAVQPPPADAHPIELGLFANVAYGKTIHARRLSPDLNAAIADLHRALQTEGLIPGRLPGLLAALGGAATLAGVAIVGGMRWWHGMIQGKPVLFVALLTLAAGGLALYLLRPPRLSGAGRHALRQTRLRVPRSKPIGQLDPMLMTVLALFGLSALADNALADLKAALQPPNSSSGGDGGDGGDGGGCGGGCGG